MWSFLDMTPLGRQDVPDGPREILTLGGVFTTTTARSLHPILCNPEADRAPWCTDAAGTGSRRTVASWMGVLARV